MVKGEDEEEGEVERSSVRMGLGGEPPKSQRNARPDMVVSCQE